MQIALRRRREPVGGGVDDVRAFGARRAIARLNRLVRKVVEDLHPGGRCEPILDRAGIAVLHVDAVVVDLRVRAVLEIDTHVRKLPGIGRMINHVVADDAAGVTALVEAETDGAIAVHNDVLLHQRVRGGVPEVDGELSNFLARADDRVERVAANDPVLAAVHIDATDVELRTDACRVLEQ